MIESVKEEGRFLLKGDLNIFSAAQLKKELFKICKANQEVHLDLRAAGQVDLSFLQILCAASMYCHENKKVFSVIGGETFWNTLEDSGYLREYESRRDENGFHSSSWIQVKG